MPHLGYRLSDEHTIEDLQFIYRGTEFKAGAKTPSDNPPLAYVRLLPVDELRSVSNYLIADLHLAAADNDEARLVADFCAVLRIAEHLRELRQFVGDLAANRIAHCALLALSEALSLHATDFDQGQLVQLQERLTKYRDEHPWLTSESERLVILDGIQRTYTDDGCGDGVFCYPAYVRLIYDREPSLRNRIFVPSCIHTGSPAKWPKLNACRYTMTGSPPCISRCGKWIALF